MNGIAERIAGVAIGAVLLASCATLPPGNGAAPAASLAGLRLEVPCANPKFTQDTECHWDRNLLQTADPQWKLKREIVRTFGGKHGTTYQVTLHVRGVVEPKNFTGGTVQFEHFQTGGTPVKNDYNFYSLHVSDPEATYVFNRNEEKVGHYTFVIDYRVTNPASSASNNVELTTAIGGVNCFNEGLGRRPLLAGRGERSPPPPPPPMTCFLGAICGW